MSTTEYAVEWRRGGQSWTRTASRWRNEATARHHAAVLSYPGGWPKRNRLKVRIVKIIKRERIL